MHFAGLEHWVFVQIVYEVIESELLRTLLMTMVLVVVRASLVTATTLVVVAANSRVVLKTILRLVLI